MPKQRPQLRAAEQLWLGPALIGATEYLSDLERPRLDEARQTASEALMTAELALGRHHQVVAQLTAMVSRYPLREKMRGLLMIALYRCGRQAEALATYDAYRRHLDDELGIDPGEELKKLRQAVLVHDPALGASGKVGRSNLEPPGQLPPLVSEIIGRSRQLAQLDTLLRQESSAIAAIVGMTGTGKTALALQAAHALREHYPEGQLYLNLAGSSNQPMDPTAALTSLLRSLYVPEAEQPAELMERASLFRQLTSGRKVLVVLDDVADEPQVRMLLPGSRARVLITSQNRLPALTNAVRVRLGALSPAAARSMLAVPNNPELMSRLLDATGRLPLALQVLGARLAAHPELQVSRLAARIAFDPFSQLRTGDLDVESRITATYRKLLPCQQHALRLLSLGITNPFSVWQTAVLLDVPLDAAQDLLDGLTERHVAEQTGRRIGRLELYTIHPLIQAYARDRSITHETAQERGAALERIHQFRGLW